MLPYLQGSLDNLCGIYAIINAERIVNDSTKEEGQQLFYEIVRYLSRKRILANTVTCGINHHWFEQIMLRVVGDRVKRITTRPSLEPLKSWWKFANKFLEEPNRAIILSFGGKDDHLTVTSRMTARTIYITDSTADGYKPWRVVFRRRDCTTLGEVSDWTKIVIYPYQCWYLGKA